MLAAFILITFSHELLLDARRANDLVWIRLFRISCSVSTILHTGKIGPFTRIAGVEYHVVWLFDLFSLYQLLFSYFNHRFLPFLILNF